MSHFGHDFPEIAVVLICDSFLFCGPFLFSCSATLATSPKPESSRNYVGLVKAPASLARQSEPPSHLPKYAFHFCHLAAQSV